MSDGVENVAVDAPVKETPAIQELILPSLTADEILPAAPVLPALAAGEPDKPSSEPDKQQVADEVEQPARLSDDEVMGHTAALWKYLPIPDRDKEPEPFPEYLHSMVDYPGGQVIAARVRGKKHKHEGTNCDDWFETANYQRITVLAAADGAGSKKFSRLGAQKSCRAAVGYLVNTLENILNQNPNLYADLAEELAAPKCVAACSLLANAVQQAVIKAYEAVEAAFYSRAANSEYAKSLGRSLQLRDLSSTLLLAVVVPLSELGRECVLVSCQVGDGMIASLNTQGEFAGALKLLGTPDGGDFSGETDFLTSPQMQNLENLQTRTRISRGLLDTVLVMTDGVSDDYFPNDTELYRLYFDLLVNGVLDGQFSQLEPAKLTTEQIKLFKQIPDPLVFPWVNDQSVKVPVQYTRRICEATGLTLAEIWQDKTVLDLARLELAAQQKQNGQIEVDSSQRLLEWLDNYVERGSFDDRTLLIFKR